METIWDRLTEVERRELLAPSYTFDLLMYPHVLDKIIARPWAGMHVNDQIIITVQVEANRKLVSEELQIRIANLGASTVYTERMTEVDAKEIIGRLRAGQAVEVADEHGQAFTIEALQTRPRTTKTFFIRKAGERKARQVSMSANELIVWVMSFALPSRSYEPCADDNFACDPAALAYRQELAVRLRAYETEWKRRPANENENISHGYCLATSGLTNEGLCTARLYCGRHATYSPGLIQRRDEK